MKTAHDLVADAKTAIREISLLEAPNGHPTSRCADRCA